MILLDRIKCAIDAIKFTLYLRSMGAEKIYINKDGVLTVVYNYEKLVRK
jgi:hypothetical protein